MSVNHQGGAHSGLYNKIFALVTGWMWPEKITRIEREAQRQTLFPFDFFLLVNPWLFFNALWRRRLAGKRESLYEKQWDSPSFANAFLTVKSPENMRLKFFLLEDTKLSKDSDEWPNGGRYLFKLPLSNPLPTGLYPSIFRTIFSKSADERFAASGADDIAYKHFLY